MYREMRNAGADLLSVAIDLQGPDLPRPFHEAANAEFTTVVDSDGVLAGIFGFRAIPNGILLDEHGVVRHTMFGGFDIRKPETVNLVRDFITTGAVDAGAQAGRRENGPVQTLDHFQRGLERYRAGDIAGAAAIWREGIELEPDHWNMRKQLWAIEHPDRFYGGDVDYDWQKEQIQLGR